MGNLDKWVALGALATLLFLAVVVSSDAYSVAAQAQASGDRALIHILVSSDRDTALNWQPVVYLADAALDQGAAQNKTESVAQ